MRERHQSGSPVAARSDCAARVHSFDSQAEAKRNVRAAIKKVAARLGNASTICRKCYLHPEILTTYLDGNLVFGIEIKSGE
jgi:DNA topoisomerase-1